MRCRLAVSLGVAGALAGAAIGQLPDNRSAPPGALPPGYAPVAGTTPPPAGGILPPGYTAAPAVGTHAETPAADIPTAIPASHPWVLKPEHGEYFISVKSYSRPSRPTPDDRGPSALALAETLAREIRDQYRVQAFLYEYISEERRAEIAAIAAARERSRLFQQQIEKYRQQSQLQGASFLEPDHKLRYKTVNYRDQIAVLIGGFKTDEDARKALDKVRAWPAPLTKVKDGLGRETSLMDYGSVVRPGPDGKPQLQQSFINPFQTASVVPSPAVQRDRPASENKLDPFVVKLNEGRPYNLLNAKKSWTLGVKSFTAPVEIVSRDSNGSAMRKFGSSKGSDVLIAGAEQAEALAEALRAMKTATGESAGLEAFVLHTRTASLVTVGQFDGPNDPELIQKRQFLAGMKLNASEDRMGLKPVANSPCLFGNLLPIPIPRP